MTLGDTGTDLVAAMADVVTEQAGAAEAARTMTAPIVEAMWDTGLMRHMNPAPAGGSEPGFAEMLATWQQMAWLDGSFGWIGIANLPSAAATAAYLPDEGFDEVFGDLSERVTLGGQFAPNGQGVKVDGGYRVSGSWNFGSGTGHSAWVCAGFLPMDDGEIVLDDDGQVQLLAGVFPREDLTFTDGWHVQGLKGTGSYDYNTTDTFVPEHRVFNLFERTPHRGEGPAFRMGLMAITAAGHAGWALGVAQSMLDDVAELALSKVRMSDMETLANRQTFQRNFAHHTGMWRAARLLVLDAFTTAEAAVTAGEPLTPRMRADMRIAATYATEASREVAQWCHLAAGTTAIREGSRLERAFRDIYTGTQHAFISEKTYLESAQVLLGLAEDHRGL
ncbi:acyl-CoA dehydrogenase family protein [Rhabdothermincola salaria]|uniref:acyl-CoA dehydrogenase family protein n=1 Tax=Rhabdothermincola salaria TaxID=2903142 RepID=UPI003D2C69B4